MQIIVKKDLLSNSEDVLNIFYGDNDAYIESWINEYFEQEIECLKMIPYKEGIKFGSLDFFVEIKDDVYYLMKKYKVMLKGYLYNSSEKVEEKLFSVRCLKYDNIDPFLNKIESQSLWNNINSEVTHRVMKRVDKDTLYKLNMKFESAIKTKNVWSSTELIMLQNELVHTYKQDLYNSVVKKMKKFEKKQGKKEISEINLSRQSNSSCGLEYLIVSKKEKYE